MLLSKLVISSESETPESVAADRTGVPGDAGTGSEYCVEKASIGSPNVSVNAPAAIETVTVPPWIPLSVYVTSVESTTRVALTVPWLSVRLLTFTADVLIASLKWSVRDVNGGFAVAPSVGVVDTTCSGSVS